MENNTIQQQIEAPLAFTPQVLLDSWMGHRRVTRRVIEAFPENKLFTYAIGGMRTFAEILKEVIGVSGGGIKGIVTGDWTPIAGLQNTSTKQQLLHLWDETTEELNTYWPQITAERYEETVLAFGQFENVVKNTVLYFIDNEIHHRGQGFVYLRALGIEPPFFYDKS